MSRRPTMYDVAERAGVSTATVSFAFRRPEQVRPATREAVLRAAHDLGYVPNAAARGLASGRTGALGLHAFDLMVEQAPDGIRAVRADADAVAPLPAGGKDSVVPWEETGEEATLDARRFPLFIDEVQRGFALECKRHGRPALITGGADTALDAAETAGRVDGLAIFGGEAAAALFESLALAQPLVLLGTSATSGRHHTVVADNRAGIRELVEHLVVEHRIEDLEYVGTRMFPEYAERFDAFRDALAAHRVPAPTDVLDDTVVGEPDTLVSLAHRLRSGSLPRALVCATDEIALSVLDLLTEAGVRVPDDVVVTGFDGILAGRLSTPSLTTVRQPMEAIGRMAARLLIEESEQGSTAPREYRLGTRLECRESCGCRG